MGKGSGRGGDSRFYLRGGHAAHVTRQDIPLGVGTEYIPTSSNRRVAGGTRSHCHGWKPKGLVNVGNTCYANAALQCLLSTALTHALLDPKASAIFRRYSSNPALLEQGSGSADSADDAAKELKDRDRRRLQENCRWLTRELKSITLEYQQADRSPSISEWLSPYIGPTVDPGSITKFPNRLSPCLRPYQQEDAHEFLRALLSTLVMNGQNKQLSSLFDGLLESAVTCLHCRRPSLTRDRYMDLSLDICGSVGSLHEALDEFTKTETLSGDNKVFCSKCNTKRQATKGLRLATAPSILVCHLKRFALDPYGRLVRLNKRVTFPLRLEISDYMSRVNKARPPPYELVAVLVHQGMTCDAGHYLAYVKNDGLWYKCNDSQVTRVDVDTVLQQQAYILIYEVEEMRSKNGYASPGGATNNKSPPQKCWQDLFWSSFPCGMDDSLLSDICWDVNYRPAEGSQMSSSRRSRRKRRPINDQKSHDAHDDLSTLGESTVESAETNSIIPFRRISSSDNLQHRQRQAVGRRQYFFPDYPNSSPQLIPQSPQLMVTYNKTVDWGVDEGLPSPSDRPPAARRFSSSELPPRPEQQRTKNVVI